MQKPGKRGRTQGLVDKSITPKEFQYRRPENAEKVFDSPVILQPAGTCTLHVTAWEYRGKIVDFSFTQMADEITDPQNGENHVSRYDCCHSQVHKHQYYKAGRHFKSGESQERTLIKEIDKQETSWETVDSEYDHCYDEATTQWDSSYRRWQTNGRDG